MQHHATWHLNESSMLHTTTLDDVDQTCCVRLNSALQKCCVYHLQEEEIDEEKSEQDDDDQEHKNDSENDGSSEEDAEKEEKRSENVNIICYFNTLKIKME